MIERIRAKVKLGLKLTKKERSMYLLYIANKQEREEFLRREKELKNEI